MKTKNLMIWASFYQDELILFIKNWRIRELEMIRDFGLTTLIYKK